MTEQDIPVKTIVAATDFSEMGDAAVLRSAQIAQETGQPLHLLHTVHPLAIYPELMVSFDSHLKDYERLKQANGLESLDELAVKLRKEFNIKVKTATRIGRAHIQIADYANDISADLLVVGYKADQNILDAMIGSTVFRVLRTSTCRVLMIKNVNAEPYSNVIASVDLSSNALHVASSAQEIAPSSKVEMLHVYDLKQETLSREAGMCNADINRYRDVAIKHIDSKLDTMQTKLNNPNFSTMVVNGYIPESICKRVTETNADLIVLGKQDKSNLEEFVLGSVSKTVANMVDCDVLLT